MAPLFHSAKKINSWDPNTFCKGIAKKLETREKYFSALVQYLSGIGQRSKDHKLLAKGLNYSFALAISARGC